MPKTTSLLSAAALAFLTSHAALAADYPTTILGDHPLAYYRLEETSGTTAIDSSASGAYPGVYNPVGIYPEQGLPGIDTNCVGFSAANPDSITVGYYDAMNQQAPFSIELWCKVTSTSTKDYRCPVGNFSGWGAAHQTGWYIYQQPTTPPSFAFVTQPAGAYITANISPLVWYHLVATFDGTNASFFTNGVLASVVQNASGYQANSIYNSGNVTLGIGQRGDNNAYFDGDVDEVAYYTNALTPAQILNHYTVGISSFRVALLPPTLTQDIISTNAYAGHAVNFGVQVDGTAPFSYQWYKGGTAIAGATNGTYSFVTVPTDDGTAYDVVVTNYAGSVTSSVATLSISTGIAMDAQPTSITRNVGSAAAFEVAAEGALPLSYQWYNGDGTLIAGATNATLWLNGVQATNDQSSYYATVINPYTTLNSDSATLSVQARPVTVPLTGYARIVAADGPVAYWRLDEPAGSTNAVDAVGSFDGAYLPGNGAFAYDAPTGIPHETNGAVGLTNDATVNIPYAIEINPTGPFTVEGWISASSATTGGNDYRTVLSSMSNPYGEGPTGWLVYQTAGNNLAWWPYNGYYVGIQLTDPDQVVPGQWYYLALVSDGTNFTMYVNGVVKATGSDPGYVQNGNVPPGGAANYNYNYIQGPGLPDGSGAMVLGQRVDNAFNPFLGTIDDVAVYNKALTPLQIQGHLQNSPAVTIGASGQSSVVTWTVGTLQSAPTVTGPFTDMTGVSSPFTNKPTATQQFFRIKLQ